MAFHYCYRITNLTEKKHYYGSRTSVKLPKEDLGKDYISSSKYVRMDIRRLGSHAFRFKVLQIFSTRQAAYAFEEKCHRRLNVVHRTEFYNRSVATTTGFSTYGVRCSEETKAKISEKAKLRSPSKNVRQRISQTLKEKMSKMTEYERSQKYGNFGSSNPFYGKTHSPDIQARITKASSEHNKGENNPFYGKTHDENTRKKLSENTKRQIAERGHPCLGKTHHRVDCEVCGKNISYPMYKRWHDNGKCKNR